MRFEELFLIFKSVAMAKDLGASSDQLVLTFVEYAQQCSGGDVKELSSILCKLITSMGSSKGHHIHNRI
jgi:hypothetical protein